MFAEDKEIKAIIKEQGKNAAFEIIISRHNQNVYWQVRRMVVDHEDANDLTQDIFIKAWKYLDKFRWDSRLSTWLYRIAVNETLNFIKKQKKYAASSLEDYENSLSSKLDSEELFSGDEIQKRLQKALLKLPEKQRLVFNLRYFDEMPYEEMSKVLGKSVGGLKANYHHAVKKIEEFVFEED
jgi:RNA polymerase sigma-70 factor (ECF subfamily)